MKRRRNVSSRRKNSPGQRKDSQRKDPHGTGKPSMADRLALGTLVALLWLPPLVFDIRSKDNFRLPKELLSEVLVVISLLLLCFRLWHVGRIDWRRLMRHPAILATLPLLGVAVLGRFFTQHPEHVNQGLSSLTIGLAALLGWSLALATDEKRRLLFATLVPAAVLSVIAILQSHKIFNPFEFQSRVTQRTGLTSLAGGALDLGAYLVLPAVLAQVGLYQASSPKRRAGWGLILALCLYAMARTQTLTALAALAVASVVLWASLLPARKRLVAGVSLLLLGLVLVLGVAPLRHRVAKKVQRVAEGKINTLLTGRLDGWRAAWWMLEQRPLLGVGVGAFSTEFATAKLELSQEGVEFFQLHFEAHFASAHNEFLEAGAELGGLGLLALAWALWLLRRGLVRHAMSGTDVALLRSGAAALAMLAFTAFPLHLAIVAYPYLLLLAWILEIRTPRTEKMP